MLARYKWAERATAKIRFRPDREAVARELLEHIQDLLDWKRTVWSPPGRR